MATRDDQHRTNLKCVLSLYKAFCAEAALGCVIFLSQCIYLFKRDMYGTFAFVVADILCIVSLGIWALYYHSYACNEEFTIAWLDRRTGWKSTRLLHSCAMLIYSGLIVGVTAWIYHIGKSLCAAVEF